MNARRRQRGLTVIEILVSVGVGAILILSLGGAVGQALDTRNQNTARAELLQDAQFAMDRMLQAVGGSRRLMLPSADNPATAWREHVREQTVPASPPEPGSTLATAVLAVTLPANADLLGVGWADANNDQDFLDLNGNAMRDPGEPERIDEDLGSDNSNDGAPGIVGIDDDGDGQIDVSTASNPGDDNDEDDSNSEDRLGNGDDDGDGAVDEDVHQDMNFDGAPGVAGVDDDLDGTVDEGQMRDDDEDGLGNEDWLDPLVFYLQGDRLIERRPLPFDVNEDATLDGLDFVESVIAENVTRFRVERVPAPGGGVLTVDLTLELTHSGGDTVAMHSIVRLGGAE